MLQVLAGLRHLVNNNRRNSETFVFYLHYRVTFLILVGFSVLITTNQMVGEKIRCLSGPTNEINVHFLESYCWVSSTYSVSSAYFNETGYKHPYPGVGISKNRHQHTFRNYYQYVYLCLFIQALCFYFPHLIWKSVEGNHIIKIFNILNEENKKEKDATKLSPIEKAAAYIEERWGTHNQYLFVYIVCEFISFCNLLVQIYVVDVFLHGEFLLLGMLQSAHFSSDWMKDPIHLFPLVTNCHFKRYGATGVIDVIDSLCVLPLNALNVKMYLFIWFWFVLLIFLSFINFLNLMFNIFLPPYRLLFHRIRNRVLIYQSDKTAPLELMKVGNCGDWFILSSIKRRVDFLDYCRISEEVLKKLSIITVKEKD